MREIIVNALVRYLFFPLVKLAYKPDYQRLDMNRLQNCPENSLGKSAYQFLTARGLSIFEGYELHDIKHALLGYETNLEGEISLQFFEFGNGNKSLPVVIVLICGIFIKPESIHHFIKAYKRGRHSFPLSELQLLSNLETQLTEIHKQLSKNKIIQSI